MLVIGILIVIVLSVIAFFLMAIWRAVMGGTATNMNLIRVIQTFTAILAKDVENSKRYTDKMDAVDKSLNRLIKKFDKE